MTMKNKVSSSDVEALRKQLAGTNASVLTPGDDGYANTLERWSRAAEKPAGASVVPTNSEEVSIVVKYATEHGLDLAVKGGGHSTAGVSSTDGGLLIDLGQMRAVRVDAEKKLIYVQGGATWADVDNAAWEHKLATVGGTVADTGVGGLTLGGGYGHLTGGYGLTIDNTESVSVVLANGEITKATKDENADLFWALLGAGQNFGVSTEFVFRAVAPGEMYTGIMAFPPTPEVFENIAAAVNDLYTVRDTPEGPQTKVKGKTPLAMALARPPDAGGQTLLLVALAFQGTAEEAKPIVKVLEDIGPIMNTLSMQPYPAINKLLPVPLGMRSSMKGAAFVLPLKADFMKKVLASYNAFTEANPDAAASLTMWELYDTVKVTQGTAGSFANRGPHFNSCVMPLWSKQENDQICRQWARDVSNLYKKELTRHNEEPAKATDGAIGIRGHKGAVMLYGNYDQYDEMSKDIFGDNYERLQKLKGKYDPTNMFNKLFAITPA